MLSLRSSCASTKITSSSHINLTQLTSPLLITQCGRMSKYSATHLAVNPVCVCVVPFVQCPCNAPKHPVMKMAMPSGSLTQSLHSTHFHAHRTLHRAPSMAPKHRFVRMRQAHSQPSNNTHTHAHTYRRDSPDSKLRLTLRTSHVQQHRKITTHHMCNNINRHAETHTYSSRC